MSPFPRKVLNPDGDGDCVARCPDSDFRDVERKLRGGLRVVGRWEHITNELASMQWADTGQGRHSWKGKYADATLASFRERVDECLKMREANEELRKLLTPEEANSLNVDHVSHPSRTTAPIGFLLLPDPCGSFLCCAERSRLLY